MKRVSGFLTPVLLTLALLPAGRMVSTAFAADGGAGNPFVNTLFSPASTAQAAVSSYREQIKVENGMPAWAAESMRSVAATASQPGGAEVWRAFIASAKESTGVSYRGESSLRQPDGSVVTSSFTLDLDKTGASKNFSVLVLRQSELGAVLVRDEKASGIVLSGTAYGADGAKPKNPEASAALIQQMQDTAKACAALAGGSKPSRLDLVFQGAVPEGPALP